MEQKRLYECVQTIGIWAGQAIPEWWVNMVRNLQIYIRRKRICCKYGFI